MSAMEMVGATVRCIAEQGVGATLHMYDCSGGMCGAYLAMSMPQIVRASRAEVWSFAVLCWTYTALLTV